MERCSEKVLPQWMLPTEEVPVYDETRIGYALEPLGYEHVQILLVGTNSGAAEPDIL